VVTIATSLGEGESLRLGYVHEKSTKRKGRETNRQGMEKETKALALQY